MEPTTHPREPLFNENACAGCGGIANAEGPTPLCTDCRTKFIKFPVPNSIKLFAVLIGVVVIFAMSKVSKNLSLAVHYERGNKAIELSNYHTAQKEFEAIVDEVPDFKEAKEHLAIAAFRNLDIETFLSVSAGLAGTEVADKGIYGELNQYIGGISDFLPSDSFMNLYTNYKSSDSIPENIYEKYITAYPDEIFPKIRYASVLLNNDKDRVCDSILNNILHTKNSYVPAWIMKVSLKRKSEQYDSAEYYTDKILAENHESTYGLSAKSRTCLRQKKDKEGLKWALKSIAVEKDDPYALATLAMAYHFNDNVAERDKLLNAAKSDSTLAGYMKYTIDVMAGKEKFRN